MKLKIVLFINLLIILLELSAQTFNPTLQVFGSPVFHVFSDIENVEVSQKLNYSYGILFGNTFYLNKGAISFRTGYFIDNKKYDKVFSDTITWYPQSVSTQFHYGNIPIYLSYCGNVNDKISPFFSIGYIFGNIISQKQSRVNNNGEQSEGFGDGIENTKNPKYIYGSIGIIFNVAKSYSLFGEPYIKYPIINNSPYNYDKDSKLTIGFRLGLNYNLH